MWRNIASNALTLIIVALFVGGGLIAWAQHSYYAQGPLAQAVCLKVPKGASVAEVSRQLGAEGAVTSPLVFRLGATYADRTADLKFGSYLVPPGASMSAILDAVTKGGQSTCGTDVNLRVGVTATALVVRELDPATNAYVEVASFDPAVAAAPQAYVDVAGAADVRFRVTVAEGVTAWQIVEALKRADFLDGTVAAVPAEGTLAPDSYEIDRGTARETLLGEMAARQSRILSDLWAARAEGSVLKSPEEALVLASIVEKETGVPTERAEVASVFVNRLREGIRLQTDPTVIYGVTGGKGPLGRGLRASELRARTPYNTYVNAGLPPTPIANPGRASIEAALDPAPTNYVYFVADGTGGHAFSATLAEHNANVAKWRAIEAQRGAAADRPATGTGSGVDEP